MAGEKQPKTAADLAESAADQYGADLRRYLLRRLRHAQNARDLAQEVYLRLLRVENAANVRDPQAYLYRIASHVVYEFRMRAKQSKVSFDSDLVNDWAEDPAAAHNEELSERLAVQQQLERLLAQLPPLCRAVFLLQKQEGLSYEEVSERLNISVHAVQRYLFRALAALRAANWER